MFNKSILLIFSCQLASQQSLFVNHSVISSHFSVPLIIFPSPEGCEEEQGHDLLVQLERAVLPDSQAGSSRRGHRHSDAGVQLAAEGGGEAAEGEGE